MIMYDNLTALAQNDTLGFYSVDHQVGVDTYRVFSYQFVSHEQWLLPNALECRGITYLIKEGEEPKLVCRPMAKFFNYGELEETPDFDDVVRVFNKADGSLISTVQSENGMLLKSKTSFTSDQAVAATEWLNRKENAVYKAHLAWLMLAGFTVNLEWVSPDNRIVLGYKEPRLIALNVRNMATGEYSWIALESLLGAYATEEYSGSLEQVQDQEGIEGVVCVTRSGQFFKLKTTWYTTLHYMKDDLNSNKKLFLVCLRGQADDALAQFYEFPGLPERIREFEDFTAKFVNRAVTRVMDICELMQGATRKEYALAGQKVLEPWLFSVYMQLYCGTGWDVYSLVKRSLIKKIEILDAAYEMGTK